MTVLDQFPAQSADLAARVIAGEAVVVTPATALVHELDPVATFVFERCDGKVNGWGIVEAVVEAFDVSRDTAASDLAALLTDFADRKLVVLRPGAA